MIWKAEGNLLSRLYLKYRLLEILKMGVSFYSKCSLVYLPIKTSVTVKIGQKIIESREGSIRSPPAVKEGSIMDACWKVYANSNVVRKLSRKYTKHCLICWSFLQLYVSSSLCSVFIYTSIDQVPCTELLLRIHN